MPLEVTSMDAGRRFSEDTQIVQILSDMESRVNAALRLRQAREDLTHYRLVDACRTHNECPRAMARVTRRDNPTIRSLVRLANVLGVDLDWLLFGDPGRPTLKDGLHETGKE
jgi:transcriptional regulator with XRE-family HTH domain